MKKICSKKRFLEKVEVKSSNECWEWKASKFKDGYGAFWNGDNQIRAHRFSWEFHFGNIPEGVLVCHHCDNPSCVNPNHLFLGTIQDNINDKCKKGRADGGSIKGEEHYFSKVTNKEVIRIRELYDTGKYFQREIGELFGISRSNVGEIIRRKTWTHI